jgi:hypothetical protein
MDGAEKGRRGVTRLDHAPSPLPPTAALPGPSQLWSATRLKFPEARTSFDTASLKAAHTIPTKACTGDAPSLHAILLEGRTLTHYPLFTHGLQSASLRTVQHRVCLGA